MNQRLKEKIQEALSSVLPITAIVLLVSITIAPMPIGTMMLFLAGAVLLIIGMGFFSLGADMSMIPFGESMGTQLTKSKKVGLTALLCFVIGVAITIAEPDLAVLATQVPAIPDRTLILTVAVGVGIFLVVAMLRILFRLPLSVLLIGFYIATFALSFFTPADFVPMAFDSGGVTTGPITVPFIMALGIGMAALRSDKHSQNDSFGLVGLCSIGPILSVMLLGILYNPTSAGYEPILVPEIVTTQDVAREFAVGFPKYGKEVLIAVVPIMLMFLAFQAVSRRFQKRQITRVLIGFLYTYIGLVTFLTGANVGFLSAGYYIGSELAGSGMRWILIPLGMLIGYFIVAAEPAVHVLNRQVEEVSGGAISSKSMQLALSLGVAVSVGLAMTRVLTGISIYWFLVPGYAVALTISFFVPKLYTAIAFDSGGVASGPMATTFLLPFAMGACQAVGGNMLTDAFGIVAMVAMTPLIAIQVLGFVSGISRRRAEKMRLVDAEQLADSMIYYEEENFDDE